jgi:hypothetical protein
MFPFSPNFSKKSMVKNLKAPRIFILRASKKIAANI